MQAELSRQAEDRSGMEQQVARHSEEKRELMSTVKEDAVSKNGLFEPFLYKNEHFAKTGSGQTQGKLKNDYRFLRWLIPVMSFSTLTGAGKLKFSLSLFCGTIFCW